MINNLKQIYKVVAENDNTYSVVNALTNYLEGVYDTKEDCDCVVSMYTELLIDSVQEIVSGSQLVMAYVVEIDDDFGEIRDSRFLVVDKNSFEIIKVYETYQPAEDYIKRNS